MEPKFKVGDIVSGRKEWGSLGIKNLTVTKIFTPGCKGWSSAWRYEEGPVYEMTGDRKAYESSLFLVEKPSHVQLELF